MDEPQRLSRRVVSLTGCSRSHAEQYIEGGWVLVDGVVVDEPQFMVHGQAVTLAPDARVGPVAPATVLLNRATNADASDASLAQLLAPALRSSLDSTGIRTLRRHHLRLVDCLPLEPFASGLVVLSQDTRILRRMKDDGARLEQELVVEVGGELAPYGIAKLEQGMSIDGRVLPRAKVSWQSETRLRFAIKDVRPGQIAAMCAQVGLQVLALKRIRIGRVSLGPMASGEWRYLAPDVRF